MQTLRGNQRLVQASGLAVSAAAALVLAGLAGYLLGGVDHPASISGGAPVATPATSRDDRPVSRSCEGYACTLEGELELRERQAVEASRQSHPG